MKRFITLLLATLFLVSLYGCAEKSETPAVSNNTSETSDTKHDDGAERETAGKLTPDMMWAAIEADEYDNKTAYADSFEMNTDEFKKGLLSHFPAFNHRPFYTDESSTNEDYLIKAGTVAVYTHDDGLCIALVIAKDTHDLNEMKVVVFKSGSYSEFGVYKLGSLISDFGKSERDAETCDSAIYIGENNGQIYLFTESAKGYINNGTGYDYELRTYIVSKHLLNFCSDLKYAGSEGRRLTSRGLPMYFGKEHYTMNGSEYVLYCDAYASGTTEYTEIHNDFTKISEAIAAYFNSFGINRSSLTKRADDCRLKYYCEGVSRIAEFSFHNHKGVEGASIDLKDCTGLYR